MRNNNELAVLLGNGVSIAANNDLFIPTLTREIRERFEKSEAGGEAPDRVLARLAHRGRETGDPYKDFEAMIGPLDQQKDNLHDLRELAELVAGESRALGRAITTIETFVQSLRRLGVGHALDIIASRSVAHYDQRRVVENFLRDVVYAVDGPVTVGNLNYDSLARAGLINVAGSQMCDMVWGYSPRKFDIMDDGFPIEGARMRTSLSDFPSRRIRLVHPHGSLTWLRNPETGRVYRFDIGDLRDVDYWSAWRDGKTEWEPQVVLTNQSAKSDVVARAPFNLAYEVLAERLKTADRWLIAGYSFRDECVNQMLARVWAARKEAPNVMVVTHGDGLTEDVVLEALGYHDFVDPEVEEFLTICRCGVEHASACGQWSGWAVGPEGLSA
jgi:hypothetical protein